MRCLNKGTTVVPNKISDEFFKASKLKNVFNVKDPIKLRKDCVIRIKKPSYNTKTKKQEPDNKQMSDEENVSRFVKYLKSTWG